MYFAHEHFTPETIQLLIVLLSLEGKNLPMTQIIAGGSFTARREMSQILNGHICWRLEVGKQGQEYYLL